MLEIQEKLKFFSFGMLQDLRTLLGKMEKEGVSVPEFKKYMKVRVKEGARLYRELRKDGEKRRKEWEKITRKCPQCKKPLYLRAIKTPEGKANVKGWKSLWYCISEECTFEEYSKRKTADIIEDLRR